MKSFIIFLLSLIFISSASAKEDYFSFETEGVKSAKIGDVIEIKFKSDKKLYFYSGRLEFSNTDFELINYKFNSPFNDESEIDKEENKFYLKAKQKNNGSDYLEVTVKLKILDNHREYNDVALRLNSGVAKYDNIDGIYDIPGHNAVHQIYFEDNYKSNQLIYVFGSLIFGMAIFVSAFYIVFIKK